MEVQWSIKDIDNWSDELRAFVAIITDGHIPGKPIKEEKKDE